MENKMENKILFNEYSFFNTPVLKKDEFEKIMEKVIKKINISETVTEQELSPLLIYLNNKYVNKGKKIKTIKKWLKTVANIKVNPIPIVYFKKENITIAADKARIVIAKGNIFDIKQVDNPNIIPVMLMSGQIIEAKAEEFTNILDVIRNIEEAEIETEENKLFFKEVYQEGKDEYIVFADAKKENIHVQKKLFDEVFDFMKIEEFYIAPNGAIYAKADNLKGILMPLQK